MNSSFISNITIKTKIIFLSGLLLVALLICGGYAIITMNKIGDEITAIAEEDIPLTRIVTEITLHQLEQAVNFERAIRFGEELEREEKAKKHFAEAIHKFDALSEKINHEIKEGEDKAKEAIELAHTDAEKKEFQHVLSILTNVEKEHKSYEQHVQHIFKLIKTHKMHEAFEAAEKTEVEEEKIDHELEALLRELEEFTAKSALQAEHDEKSAVRMIGLLVIVALVLGVLFSSLIIKQIIASIKHAVCVTQVIASGDLSQEVQINSSDEMGQLLTALKEMREKLHAMIFSMNESSSELAASAEELATVSEENTRGVHTQQSEIHQAATAMNQMAATVQEVAKNAASAAASANDADQEALNGQSVVNENITSIKHLAEQVDSAANIIEQVGTDSDNIGSVLDVIKGVAEQTNLLALNAAIEAARAGEQGRGFAVVADEVRTLAQRTQESTQEIESMITRLQESASQAVESMSAGREQAQVSVEKASTAGSSLRTITQSVATISDMNTQIASAAEEQSSVAEEINKNINNVSHITEQSAAAVNQITASSEELARMATHLQQLIDRFSI